MNYKKDINLFQDEIKDYNTQYNKGNQSRFDYELFDETSDVPSKVIRVKRLGASDKTERWKIFNDTEVILTLNGQMLSKREREFLRTAQGINFLLNLYKNEILNISQLRRALKKEINNK